MADGARLKVREQEVGTDGALGVTKKPNGQQRREDKMIGTKIGIFVLLYS
jgi:hypothetical protein